MQIKKIVVHLTAAGLLSTMLMGCGGGGSSSSSSTTAPTLISGTVATGAPVVDAKVSVSDANAKTLSTTADTNGNYSFDASGLTAPLSITATDPNNQSSPLVAVLATLPSAGSTGVANVTTLTTAQTALLSPTGNAFDVTSSTAQLKTLVTTDNLKQAIATLTQTLNTLLQSNGVTVPSTGFDPVGTPFTANDKGVDAVINSVRLVNGNTSGDKGSTSSTQLVSIADPTNTIALNNSTGTSNTPSALATPGAAPSVMNAYQTAMQNCINAAVANGGSTKDVSACSGLVDSNYLDNGYTSLGQEFPDLKTATTSGATVGMPRILMFYSLSSGDSIQTTIGTNGSLSSNIQFNAQTPGYALVQIPFVLKDGTPSRILTVAKNTNGTWALHGNQNNYDASITSQLIRRTYLDSTDANNSRFESGLNLVFNPSGPNSSGVNAVKIQGPGLPSSGLWLETCSATGASNFMCIPAIQPSGAPTSTVSTANNTSFFRWSWAALQEGGTAPTVPTGNAAYSSNPISSETTTIGAPALPMPYSPYLYTLYDSTGKQISSFSVVNVAPPILAKRGYITQWNSLDSSVINNFLSPTGSLAGTQSSVPVSWTSNAQAIPVQRVAISTNSAGTEVDSGDQVVPVGQTNVTVTAPNSLLFQALGSSNSSRNVQLRAINPDEIHFSDQSVYQSGTAGASSSSSSSGTPSSGDSSSSSSSSSSGAASGGSISGSSSSSSSGGSSSGSNSSTKDAAFPSQLVLTSPTTPGSTFTSSSSSSSSGVSSGSKRAIIRIGGVGSSSSSSSGGSSSSSSGNSSSGINNSLPIAQTSLEVQSELETIRKNPSTLGQFISGNGLLLPEGGYAPCYGPNMPYINHPDGTLQPGMLSTLPGGDLGIWQATVSADNNPAGDATACAAAQLNRNMYASSFRVNVGLELLAALRGVSLVSGTTLTAGSSQDLTTAMNSLGLTPVTFNTATLALDSTGTAWTYTVNLTFTDPTTSISHTVEVSLQHTSAGGASSSDNAYSGLMTYKITDMTTLGNCSAIANGAQSWPVVHVGTLKYDHANSTSMAISHREAVYCGDITNLPSNLLTRDGQLNPASGFNLSTAQGWADNFKRFAGQYNPQDQSGNYIYAWQAGFGDTNTRILATNIQPMQSNGSQTGGAYFGFGANMSTTDGSILGMICNWAGPGNNHSVVPQYVQYQSLAWNSTLNRWEVGTAGSKIRYAPTNSCMYTHDEVNAGDTFWYDRDLTGNTTGSPSQADLIVDPSDSAFPLGLEDKGTFSSFKDMMSSQAGYTLPSNF